MRRTPLYELHLRLGARMVQFAGYELPVQYAHGIRREHEAVRNRAGIFDVSHMAQFEISGAGAADLASRACPLRAAAMPLGTCRYTFFLTPSAGIVDDLILTRLAPDRYVAVTNASRREEGAAHLAACGANIDAEVQPLDFAILAIQGPEARRLLRDRLTERVDDLWFMHALELPGGGVLSATGYTGEDGFEAILPGPAALDLADRLLPDAEPVGLGARDSLRLEAGLCLYGQDLTTGVTPVDAGLTWAIARGALADGRFVGAEALRDAMARGSNRRRVGIRPEGRAPVRAGAQLTSPNGAAVGVVTSGGYGPTLSAPIAMAFVETANAAAGARVNAQVRGKSLPCRVQGLPFVPHRYRRKSNP